VVSYFQKHSQDNSGPCNILCVQNDGVMVKGKSLEQVFDRLEVLEATSSVVLECMALGTLNLMTDQQTDEIDEKWFGQEKMASRKRRKTEDERRRSPHFGCTTPPRQVTK
jgi:ribulose-5-phosphate 4-epimerase/fuculose-1-phosphate aldolase